MIWLKIIFISFTCLCLLPSSQASWSRYSDINCTIDNQQLYCSDCLTVNLCNADGTEVILPCGSGKACQQDGLNAYCTDVINVPACECLVYPSSIPDAYDQQKFINCTENGPVVVKCPNDGFFNPNTSLCATCLSNNVTNIALNCTHYNATTECQFNVYECSPGQFVDAETGLCVEYITFNCQNHPIDGVYADSHNCSVFHYCSRGQEPGDPFACPPGQVFNVTSCVVDDGSVECPCEPVIPKYVVCNDGLEIYPTKNCKIFYTCTETSPGVYQPTLNECPGDWLFNPMLLECNPPILVPMCDVQMIDLL